MKLNSINWPTTEKLSFYNWSICSLFESHTNLAVKILTSEIKPTSSNVPEEPNRDVDAAADVDGAPNNHIHMV